jgi:hypothetical protein
MAQSGKYPGPDSKGAPPEYGPRASQLLQLVSILILYFKDVISVQYVNVLLPTVLCSVHRSVQSLFRIFFPKIWSS